MATKRYPKILFFIKGVMPSIEAQEVADEYGPNVAFRNAHFVKDSGSLEACDGVAGEVPEAYKKLPSAEEACAAFEKARKESGEKARKNAEKRAEEKAKAEEEAKAKAEEEAKAKAEAEEKAKEAKANPKPQTANTAKANKPADWKPNA